MPPGKKLPTAVVEDFVTWVNAGAVWPATAGRPDAFVARKHWAFQPVKAVQSAARSGRPRRTTPSTVSSPSGAAAPDCGLSAPRTGGLSCAASPST